ncbi:MAG: nicotinamide-nucleotide amidohydrolase family protein [Deltaproteobacteria bacterium]|nr:nicotinamide-nucleotide amidohydrolase family protein [Deltaproteobacteria bacterium]
MSTKTHTDTKKKPLSVIIKEIGQTLRECEQTLATAESCTGGLLGDNLTNTPGSSKWFKGGVIAYSNEVKVGLLFVKKETLKKHGAVSKEVAKDMASGVRKRLKSDIGVAITGIAGPDKDETKKPVGLVFIALSSNKKTIVKKLNLSGSRIGIKKASITALTLELKEALLREEL